MSTYKVSCIAKNAHNTFGIFENHVSFMNTAILYIINI